MQFDPMTALDIARRFARPRLAGSGEDERVAGEAAALLEGWGWRVQRQRFECSTAQGLFITAGVATCMVLALLSLALRSASPWAAAVPAVSLIAAIALAPPLYQAAQAASVRTAATPQAAWRRLGFRAGRRFALENLAAEWPDPPADPDRPHVILMAHYDSKSQRIPLVVRVACFALVIAGSLALAAFTLAGALVPGPALDSLARIAVGIVLVAGVPLLFLGAGNASPGAIDNASGLGTVLHLAECLARRPDLLGRVRVTPLLPNAEELGVLGSAAYLQQHEPALLQKAGTGGLYVLNFDGVGVDADVRLAGAQINRRAGGRMAGLVQSAAAGRGLTVKPFSMVGLSYDHVPFADRGFDAVSLIAIGQSTWSVHTPRDNAAALHPRGFAQAGSLAIGVVEMLAGEDSMAFKGTS